MTYFTRESDWGSGAVAVTRAGYRRSAFNLARTRLGVLTSTVVDSVDGGFASDAEVVSV